MIPTTRKFSPKRYVKGQIRAMHSIIHDRRLRHQLMALAEEADLEGLHVLSGEIPNAAVRAELRTRIALSEMAMSCEATAHCIRAVGIMQDARPADRFDKECESVRQASRMSADGDPHGASHKLLLTAKAVIRACAGPNKPIAPDRALDAFRDLGLAAMCFRAMRQRPQETSQETVPSEEENKETTEERG